MESSSGTRRKPLPSSGQIPHLPSGPMTATLRPSGDTCVPAVPSGVRGLAIAVAQINQIIADSVAGLDSGGQQLFAIRQVTHRAVADVVVGQLPGFAGAGWYQAECPSLGRLGDHPFIVRRNCFAGAVTDPNRRRPVGVAQKHRVVRPTAFRLFLEQNFLAVTAYVSRQGPAEPAQFDFLFSAGRQGANSETGLVCNHQRKWAARILQPHASRHVNDCPHLAGQGHAPQIRCAAAIGGGEPDLIACG